MGIDKLRYETWCGEWENELGSKALLEDALSHRGRF
jgi:hypothetical protein